MRWRLPANAECDSKRTELAADACSTSPDAVVAPVVNSVSCDKCKETCSTGALAASEPVSAITDVSAGDTAPAAAVIAVSPAVPFSSSSGHQAALLDAWATVHAPEEVFFPTALALLGYLRDSPALPVSQASSAGASQAGNSASRSGNNNSTSGAASTTQEVRIAMVNFAEWARRGDAHPVQYDHIDAHLVKRMTAAGALFGRKFAAGSVSVNQWRAAVGLQAAQAGGSSAGYSEREGREHRDREGRDWGYDNYSHHGGYRSNYSDQYHSGNYGDPRYSHSGSNNSGYGGSYDRDGYQDGEGCNKRRRY